MIDTNIEQPQPRVPFNPNEHLMQIKNRGGATDYLPVQWRLVWFRSLCPNGTIETEIVHLDMDRETEEEGYAWNNETRRSEKVMKRALGFAICRATVKDGRGGVAMGTKSEKAASFPDFLEKAETGAIGRALAGLGYGTQFAPELDEQHRIVDAPADRGTSPALVENTNNDQRPAHANNPRTQIHKPAESAPAHPTEKPLPVSLNSLVTVANKRYPGGWVALKAKIADEFGIMGEVTDELIANDYNTDAQAFVRDAMKPPVAQPA
jgi:hypothetical protein